MRTVRVDDAGRDPPVRCLGRDQDLASARRPARTAGSASRCDAPRVATVRACRDDRLIAIAVTGTSKESTGIEHVGSNANPMQFQNSEGGSWGTHVQNDHGATCGNDYKGDYSATVLGTYDSRN